MTEKTDQTGPPPPSRSTDNPRVESAKKVFGPRCLVPLLGLEADQRVLFVGHDRSLVHSVKRRGARPLNILLSGDKSSEDVEEPILVDSHAGPLPLEDASVHHVVAPSTDTVWWSPHWLSEAARVTVPGATLMFGATARFRFPLRPGARTPASGRRLLSSAGFDRIRVYGVRHGFHDPRFLVPLDHPGARTWFLGSAYTPQKTRQARLAGFLSRLPRTRLDHVYFPNLLFVARRERRQGC